MSAKPISLWLNSRRLPERIALVCGAVALASCGLHLVAFPFSDGAVWSGPVGFRKPAMFGFSIGVTLLSLGWIMRHFPDRPRWHATLVGAMSGALLVEVMIIALQRFRGVPSHFNMATVFDGVLWSMMGLSITIFALLAMVMAAESFGRLNAPPPIRTAIRAAMVLLVFSQISGQLIVLNGMSVVLEGGEYSATNIARAATFGAAGDLKLPHAISLHGLQVLPLLGAWVARLNWTAGAARFWIALSGAGFFGLAVTAQVHAYTGRALADIGSAAAAAMGASLMAFALPWLLAAHAAVARLRMQSPVASALATP
jgi:hypothetical protein